MSTAVKMTTGICINEDPCYSFIVSVYISFECHVF